MTDSPYGPVPPIVVPADHPLLDASGFMDLYAVGYHALARPTAPSEGYTWPTEPITGELSGAAYPEAAQAFEAMHCPSCGLPWGEMRAGHTWRADGSACWQEDEDE